MDIRLLTGLIIRKDGQYLVCKDEYGNLKWNNSPYHAWRTRVRAEARSIQEKVGGEICLFNPASGEIRDYEQLR